MADSTTLTITSILGPAASVFMAGFSASASFITMPSLYALPASSSTVVVASLFQRGGLVAAPASLTAALCCGTAAYLLPASSGMLRGTPAASEAAANLVAQKRTLFTVSAVLALSNLAWTRIVMMPAISRVLTIAGSKALQASVSSAEVSDLLWKWQWQNYVRAVNSTVAAAIGFYAYAL